MFRLLQLADELFDSDRLMTEEEYRNFMDNILTFSKEEQEKIVRVLLIEIACCPSKLTLEDFEIIQNIADKKRLEIYLSDAMEIAFEHYGKKPIFNDNNLANAISKIFGNIKRCEYLTLMAILNNGFGDKNAISTYLKSIDKKVFKYSSKWTDLYRKANRYASTS